jgi:hypothetical protein
VRPPPDLRPFPISSAVDPDHLRLLAKSRDRDTIFPALLLDQAQVARLFNGIKLVHLGEDRPQRSRQIHVGRLR